MPRIKGRAEQQRHFRCESSRDRGKTEAVLYVLFYLSFFFFFLRAEGGWTLKSCRNVQRIFVLILYLTAFNAQVFLYLLCSEQAAPLLTDQDLDPYRQCFSSVDHIQPYKKTLFSLNMLFTGCLLIACIPMLYPCSALFMLLSYLCFSRLTSLQYSTCRLSVQWKGLSRSCLYIMDSVGTCEIFSYNAGHFFIQVFFLSFLTCIHYLKPVEDLPFYIFMFLLPFWKLICKYFC